MTAFTYAELFAGAGGLSMGLETAGWTAVAHAEIEPHARAVLREHWPDCPMHGDVDAFLGGKRMRQWFRETYTGKVTLLSGGSPCQDLSVAGKRRGMKKGSGTRSSLFFRQVSARNLCNAPYFLWENVLGALSSNAGRDFAAVLSALVGAAVPVPADGWQSAGVAAGPTGVAAWRVLDCQFFGPPQRRRRVFVLGARTGGVDPAEVLALAEGVRGDSAARGQAREGVAADAGRGTGGAGGDADDAARGGGTGSDAAFRVGRGVADAGGGVESDSGVAVAFDGYNLSTSRLHHTLPAQKSAHDAILAPADAGGRGGRDGAARAGRAPAGALAVNVSDGAARLDPVMGTLGARSGGQEVGAQTRGVVMAFDSYNQKLDKVDATLSSGESGRPIALTYDARGNGDGQVANTLAFHQTQDPITEAELSPALGTTSAGMGALVLRNREGKPGGGKGPLIREEQSLTLGTGNDQVLFTQTSLAEFGERSAAGQLRAQGGDAGGGSESLVVANTVTAREHKGWNPARDVGNGTVQADAPRRLMPIECERLMGWPDHHTAHGVAEDGTRYALSDTARYRLCGNGVASPVAGWIAWRLRWALENAATGRPGRAPR